MSSERVVITGVGVVNAAVAGDSRALGAFLAAPRAAAGRLPAGVLAAFVDEHGARRLSRVCQLAAAAARLALTESRYAAADGLGLVVGTEFGDLRSTLEFAEGYLERGPIGLSALLFPNTVMNTMAATTAIALGARELSLTLNVPAVAGELAVARASAAVAAGRVNAALAGGVDELDPVVVDSLVDLGAGGDVRGEGAAFVVLESGTSARRRAAPVLGEILGAAWRTLRARPHGIGRGSTSRAIGPALDRAGTPAARLGWAYTSASGDAARDRWQRTLLARALPGPVAATSLHGLVGHHSGLGALRVGAAAWTARSGLLPAGAGGGEADGAARSCGGRRVPAGPGLVHGLARGGTEVAMVVTGPES